MKATLMSKNKKELQKLPTYGQLFALAKAKALAPCDLKIEAAFPVSADVNNPKQRVPFALGSDSLTTVDRHMLRLLS
ncbi:hypothetical protein T09_5937 [Trichinella sp. T9]|nr:hypothetical protein T09_5937 [Trichinella sp. T9]